jgi:Holliday junction resolvase RusA-like endonuclease
MTNSITITVPIPKSDQNKSMHHRQKSQARQSDWKKSKESSQIAVNELYDWESYGFPWVTADIHVRWYHPTTRLKDTWNIVGCLKGTLDGIVRSGVLADDNEVQPPTIERLTDRENPRVELTLTKEE